MDYGSCGEVSEDSLGATVWHLRGDTAVFCDENQELEEVSLVEKTDPPVLSLPVVGERTTVKV